MLKASNVKEESNFMVYERLVGHLGYKAKGMPTIVMV